MAGQQSGNGRRARRPLRVLHTSDVHLGFYDHGSGAAEAQREHMHRAFSRVIDVGLREHIDLLLIPGDFFDNARVHIETMRFAAAEIARLEATTVILPGNHDHVGRGSVYDRLELTELAQNLVIMRDPRGEYVELPDLDVEIWGRSHVEDGRPLLPFEGAPARRDAGWHIGMGHGHFVHPKSGNHPSYHIREEHLAGLDHDYVALGHWEQQRRVAAGQVLAAYSGAPDGIGSQGGRVLIADFQADGEVRLTSVSLGDDEPIEHDDIPIILGGDPPHGFR